MIGHCRGIDFDRLVLLLLGFGGVSLAIQHHPQIAVELGDGDRSQQFPGGSLQQDRELQKEPVGVG